MELVKETRNIDFWGSAFFLNVASYNTLSKEAGIHESNAIN